MATPAVPRSRDVLGTPLVPPAWAERGVLRLRSGVGRLHTRMVPGFNHLLERLLGMADTKALYVAVELRLPELLEERPRSARELAEATGADPDALERLLRFLVMRGFFSQRKGRYRNNAASSLLRADHPFSFRDWVLFFGSDWNAEVWNKLGERVRTGKPAAEAALGVPFFTYLGEHNREAGRAFNGAMASGSRLQGILFAETVDLRGVGTVCDVGGGSGSVLAHLLRVHPELRGVVCDLPSLEAEAKAVFEAAGVGDRATFAGGDFFASVPPGCDLYVLFAVVHDWGDDDCARILANIREAMAPGGRIMVVEGTVKPGPGEDFFKIADMLMLAYADGGRERTAAEFDALWRKAGLRVQRITTLPSTFHVFELVPA